MCVCVCVCVELYEDGKFHRKVRDYEKGNGHNNNNNKNKVMKKKKEEEWEQGRIEIIEIETKHLCALGMV